MAEQIEKAFLKQPEVFFCSKKSGKGKAPRKGWNRYWKSIGLGFKKPREAIKGVSHIINFVAIFYPIGQCRGVPLLGYYPLLSECVRIYF